MLAGFDMLRALPLSGGVGAAHATAGILPEAKAKRLLAFTASHLVRYARLQRQHQQRQAAAT